MVANTLIYRQTSTSGRMANTTDSTNSTYIARGDFAVNLADQKMYISNGEIAFEVGANLTSLSIANTLILSNTITINSTSIVLGPYVELNANGSSGTPGQFLTSNGHGIYWSTLTANGSSLGTVTAISTSNGIGGGPITTTGDLYIIANTGLIVNAAGLFVNSAYINTISSNNATYAFDKTESNLNVNNALTSNNASYLLGRTWIAPGTIGSTTANTGRFTTANATTQIFVGANVHLSTSQIRVGNSTVNSTVTQAGIDTDGTLNVTGATTLTSVNASLITLGSSLAANNTQLVLAPGYSVIANSTAGTTGQILTSNGSSVYWSTLSVGSISSVYGNTGLQGGGTTGDLVITLKANTGIIANVTGVYVNSAYINTISSNNSVYAFGKTESNLNVNNALTSNNASYLLGQTWASPSTIGTTAANGAIFTTANATEVNIGSTIKANSSQLRLTGLISLSVNGSTGTFAQVLATNGSSMYWKTDSDTDTTYTIYTAANTAANEGRIRLTDSSNSNDDILLVGSGGVIVSSNSTQVTITSSDQYVGTVTNIATSNGLSGGPITSTGTIGLVVNTGLSVNSSGLFVNSAYINTISSNNASYLGGLISTGYQTTAGLASNVATLTANNSTYLNGQTASYYTNATNIVTGTLPYAQLGPNVVNTTFAFTITGAYNFSNTISIVGLIANGSVGSAAQVLASNGSSTYWTTRVFSVSTANGLSGGTITSTGTIGLVVNTGLSVNSSGLFVNSAYINTISANNSSFLGDLISTGYQTTAGLSANVATLTSNNSSNFNGQPASYYANATNLTGGILPYARLDVNVVNTTHAFTISGVHTHTANTVLNGLIANGSIGTAGQVLASNGSSTYWKADSDLNTTYDLSSVANTAANAGRIRLTDSSNANDDVLIVGAGQTVVSSNSTQITISTSDQFVGTVTNIATSNGLSGGPITSTGTIGLVANTGLVVNTSGLFVNSSYINTISSNNASYLGGLISTGYQTTAGLSSNVATLSANNATYLNGQLASYYTNATNIVTGTLPYAQLGPNVVNTTHAFTISGVHTHTANTVLAGIIANGSIGTAGQVLASNGSSTYWKADSDLNTTYDLTSVANTAANAGRIRLSDSSNANDDVLLVGSGQTIVSSNSTQITISTSDQFVGTVTNIATSNGLSGGPITSTGTIGLIVNTGLVVNTSGLFVNSAYVNTISANNSSFLGGLVSTGYQTTAGLSANVATLTSNNASYLLGLTWTSPGAIGSTTANTGAFTNISASGNVVLSNTLFVTGSVNLTTPLGVSSGGVNITSYTIGDILYASASGVLTKLPIGVEGFMLQTNSSNLPYWGSIDCGTY